MIFLWFSMIFLWFSYVFPMIFLWFSDEMANSLLLKPPPNTATWDSRASHAKALRSRAQDLPKTSWLQPETKRGRNFHPKDIDINDINIDYIKNLDLSGSCSFFL